MAKVLPNGAEVKYDSYEEYVERQDARSHDYDCPNCLKLNMENMDVFVKAVGKRPKRVLDIGCRDAGWFETFGRMGMDCSGIDVSPKSVKYASSMGRDVRLGDADKIAEIFKDDELFDLILSSHSFEHFLKPDKVMRQCRKVMTDDGHMIIRLPNQGGKIKGTKFDHVKAYLREELIEIFKNAGFAVFFETTELQNKDEWYFILRKQQ